MTKKRKEGHGEERSEKGERSNARKSKASREEGRFGCEKAEKSDDAKSDDDDDDDGGDGDGVGDDGERVGEGQQEMYGGGTYAGLLQWYLTSSRPLTATSTPNLTSTSLAEGGEGGGDGATAEEERGEEGDGSGGDDGDGGNSGGNGGSNGRGCVEFPEIGTGELFGGWVVCEDTAKRRRVLRTEKEKRETTKKKHQCKLYDMGDD